MFSYILKITIIDEQVKFHNELWQSALVGLILL